jgi:cytochrome c-type biogenesis protein CcmH
MSSAQMPQAHAYAELERHLLRQPSDARALVLKARIDMQAQRFDLAAAAYQKALQGPSKVAGDAAVWVEYAEARGMLQGGTLKGEPQQLVEKALSLDPTNRQALDLAGSAAWEQRDFATASRYWKRLLEQIPADSERRAELSAAIGRADERARFSLPPAR